jgi:hypothetical protein
LHCAHRPQQQIAEIGEVGVAQPALVLAIDVRRQAQAAHIDREAVLVGVGDDRLDRCRRHVGCREVVLERRQPGAEELQRVTAARVLAGKVQRLQGAF